MKLQTFGDKYFGAKFGTSFVLCILALIGDENMSAIMSIVCTYDPYDTSHNKGSQSTCGF